MGLTKLAHARSAQHGCRVRRADLLADAHRFLPKHIGAHGLKGLLPALEILRAPDPCKHAQRSRLQHHAFHIQHRREHQRPRLFHGNRLKRRKGLRRHSFLRPRRRERMAERSAGCKGEHLVPIAADQLHAHAPFHRDRTFACGCARHRNAAVHAEHLRAFPPFRQRELALHQRLRCCPKHKARRAQVAKLQFHRFPSHIVWLYRSIYMKAEHHLYMMQDLQRVHAARMRLLSFS